jgi:hypothetical protein
MLLRSWSANGWRVGGRRAPNVRLAWCHTTGSEASAHLLLISAQTSDQTNIMLHTVGLGVVGLNCIIVRCTGGRCVHLLAGEAMKVEKCVIIQRMPSGQA